MNKEINIICFDNPYPPNYGGVIEVYFKIKAFHSIGYSINLHCYVKQIPIVYDELQKLCKEVFFYKIKSNPLHLFSSIPFSVLSRFDSEIIDNLNKNKAPILFEGLKTTHVLNKAHFNDRKIILRLHNIEEFYYDGISKNETSWLKRIAFKYEGRKYLNYKSVFSKFNAIVTLSNHEYAVLKSKFEKTFYIPVFHGNDEVVQLYKKGEFALFHADLKTSDNRKSLEFIVSVFKNLPNYKLVIASGNKEKYVNNLIKNDKNIEFKKIDDFNHLKELLFKAHLTINWSFQNSGTKLKSLNSLFNSRFCIINENIIDDEIVSQLCVLATNKKELTVSIKYLFTLDFEDYLKRKEILENYMSNINNINLLDKLIYN